MRSTRLNSGKSLRRELAHAAARLVVEGSCRSFAAAKRKAAARMGLDNFHHLPDNNEVQSAVIEYQRVFEGDHARHRVDLMRREALAAMLMLVRFRPRLVGPVLYGSACDHSPVTLHLYTDELEGVTRFLYEQKIDYRLTDTTFKISSKLRETFPTYVVTNKGLEFELVVLPMDYLAHPPLSSLDGRPYKRVDADGLRKLIDAVADSRAEAGGSEINVVSSFDVG